MSSDSQDLEGPDLSAGIGADTLSDGEMLQGHAGGESVLLVRWDGRWLAVGAHCTHYGVALVGGLLVDGTVRCPAHHAAFDLASGRPTRGPALRELGCWEVEEREGRVYVTRPRPAVAAPSPAAGAEQPGGVVIVGAGAAGTAAAAELRRQGYAGRLTLLSAEPSAPYDRPNVSKDFLAGSAPEEWMPLLDEDYYRDRGIDLLTGTRVSSIDPSQREVVALGGRRFRYDRLLLATGADPVRLRIPTHKLSHVHYLRSIEDARKVVGAAEPGRRAVVIGASFIGLEAAAALRARGVEVTVVAPHDHPLGQVLGAALGDHIRSLHEGHGVRFHLGAEVHAITADEVTLQDGTRLAADLVVVGIGVRPGVGLASWAGLALHQGAIAVNEHLETSVPGVYAAGDIASWPDPRTGARIRSEHWVVAHRQGQTAARNILGAHERFDAVPFFWSAHYDTTIQYVGHAQHWDRIDSVGSPADASCLLAYRQRLESGGQRTLAVAAIGNEQAGLRAELALERGDEVALQAMIPLAPAGAHA